MTAFKYPENISIQEVSSLLHNRRQDSKRINFYRGEFPSAQIIVNNRKYETEVFDLSTDGISLLPKCEIPGLDMECKDISVKLHNSAPRKAHLKSISHTKFAGSIKLKIGLKLEADNLIDLDSTQGINLSSILPMAYANDPVLFKQVMMFNVNYFAPKGIGLIGKFETSALFPGLVLDLSLMLPARGEFHAVVEVIKVQQVNHEYHVSCKWLNISGELENRISEFLLMSEPNLTIANLRDRGFAVGNLERAFVFGYAQTDEQMTRILELRLKAAQADGRWLGETDVEKMRDPWDKYARQVFCEVNGRVVGAGRVVFNNGDKSRSEHESNYKVEIPDWLWQEGFVEGSRVCTDPEFRGADVFMMMIQNVSKIVVASGYRYFVMNCVDSLVPVYRRTAGIKSLNKRFFTEYMQDRALNLLYADIRKLQLGINLKASTWVINAPVGTHLIEQGVLQLHWWEKIPHYFARLVQNIVIDRYEKSRLNTQKNRKHKLKLTK